MGIQIKITFAILAFFLSTSFVEAGTLSKPANNLGLVGYWSFNEGTSTVATDFSGRGNHGTLSGFANPPTASSGWGIGKFGAGLNFDGTSDYVDTNYRWSSSDTSITISQWIKSTATAYSNIVANYDGLGSTIETLIENGNYKSFIRGSNSAHVNPSSTATVNDGRWHHVVTVVSGTVATQYVDGVQDGSASNGLLDGNYDSGSDLFIGQDALGDNDFAGSIDEVRIYNRPLTGAEIRALYQSGLAKINSSQNNLITNGLVGMWSFDGADMSGTTAYDRSGSGYNGTLFGVMPKLIGKVGQALDFGGASTQYINASGANFALTPGGRYSWGVWINSDNLSANGGWGVVFNQSNAGDAEEGIILHAHTLTHVTMPGGSITNGISVQWMDDSPARLVTEAEGVLQAGQWHYVFITYDGTLAQSSRFRIYVDGADVTGSSASSGTLDTLQSTNMRIGGNIWYTGDRFDGKIDEVRFYNRLVTPSEIKTLFNAGGSKINTSQASPPGTTLGSGLVGYWSLNGPDFTDRIYDRSGQGNDGYMVNMATSTAKSIGKMGQALLFDGLNDYVRVPTSGSLTLSSRGTLSAWVKFTADIDATDRIAVAGNANSFWIGINDTGGTFVARVFDGTNKSAVGTTVANEGSWYHVVGKFDGSNIHIYINGVWEDSTPAGNINYESEDARVTFGSYADGSGGRLTGIVDEVRLYNRTLSDAEIKQLYLLGK